MATIKDLYAVIDNKNKAIPIIKQIIKENPNNELLIKTLSPLLIKNNIVYNALWETRIKDALSELKRILPRKKTIKHFYIKDHDILYKGRRYDSIK